MTLGSFEIDYMSPWVVYKTMIEIKWNWRPEQTDISNLNTGRSFFFVVLNNKIYWNTVYLGIFALDNVG